MNRLYMLLLLAIASHAAQAQKIITGTVRNNANLQGLAAAVTIQGKTIYADSTGRFTITNLGGAKYKVIANYVGYTIDTLTADLTGKDSINLNFYLTSLTRVPNEAVEDKVYFSTPTTTQSVGGTTGYTYNWQGGKKERSKSANIGAVYSITSSGNAATRVADWADVAEPEIADDTLGNNNFRHVARAPFSTFSIDVDDGSYALMRKQVSSNALPRKDEVRTEEFINYFNYKYPHPATTAKPFSVYTEMSACPWNPANKLLHVGIQGYDVVQEKLPPSNLVFLIDVSGSMQGEDRIGLIQKAFGYMVDNLSEKDLVSIVVYAGSSGLVLPPTPGNEKLKLKEAVNRLTAGGSTAGGAGIQLAYKTALNNFIKEGNNRVILCTDGDFNVGISDEQGLIKLIEEQRKSNVFLSVIGCGSGNYQDKKMEQLADHGNGYYGYMDDEAEAKRIFSKQLGATLLTIAKDVKLQVEFNPAWVKEYKLVGYENRELQDVEFADDKKDAGELGAGSSVTALYELVLYPQAKDLKTEPANKQLQYATFATNDLAALNIRYKLPKEDKSTLSTYMLPNNSVSPAQATTDFNFAAAVAMAGIVLKDAKNKGNASLDMAYALASKSKGEDKDGYRTEFIDLLAKLKKLDTKQ